MDQLRSHAVVNASERYSMQYPQQQQQQHHYHHQQHHRHKVIPQSHYIPVSSGGLYSNPPHGLIVQPQYVQRIFHTDPKHHAYYDPHSHQMETFPPPRIHTVESPQIKEHHNNTEPDPINPAHYSSLTVKPHYSQSLRPPADASSTSYSNQPHSVQAQYALPANVTPSMNYQRTLHQRSATLPPSNQLSVVMTDGTTLVPQPPPPPLPSRGTGGPIDSRIRHFSSYHTVTGYAPQSRALHQRQRCYSGGGSSAEGSTVTTLSVNGPQYRSYYTAIGGRVFHRTAPPVQVVRPGHHASSVSAFSADLERQTRAPTRHRGGHHTRHHTALGLRDGFMSSSGNTASPWGRSSSDGITFHPTAGSLFTSAVAAAVDSLAESVDNMRKNVQNNGPITCEVTMLDGREEVFHVSRSSKGMVLFEQVCKSLDLYETEYFGLTYRGINNMWFWLSLKKKIRKYLPSANSWKFEFQVKFYPVQPIKLKEPLTRYLLCMQIRQDVICKKLPCSFNTFAILGAYVVQAELGDYKASHHGEGIEYIHDMLFAPSPMQTRDLLERIVEIHKLLKGLSPVDADIHFMDNAKKLSLYGVDFHKAKDMNDEDLMVGVYHGGILVYVGRLRIKRFFWSKILKISYLRCVFRLFLRPHDHSNQVGKLVEFRCQCSKMAKRLWKACVEHHAFFRLREQEDGIPRRPAFFAFSGQTRTSRRFDHSPQPHKMTDTVISVRASSAQPASLTTTGEGEYGMSAPFRQRGKTLLTHRKASHQRVTPSRPVGGGGGFIPRHMDYGINPEWYATSVLPYPQSSNFSLVLPHATLTTACQTSFDDQEHGAYLKRSQEFCRVPNSTDSNEMSLQPRVIHHAAHRSPQKNAKGIHSTNSIIPPPEENVVSNYEKLTDDQVDLHVPTAFRPPRDKSSTRSINGAILTPKERTLQRSPFPQSDNQAKQLCALVQKEEKPSMQGVSGVPHPPQMLKLSDTNSSTTVSTTPFLQPTPVSELPLQAPPCQPPQSQPTTNMKYSPLPSRHVECHFHPITSPLEQGAFNHSNSSNFQSHSGAGNSICDSTIETVSYQLYQPQRVHTQIIHDASSGKQDAFSSFTLGDYPVDKFWHDTSRLTHGGPHSHHTTEQVEESQKDGPIYAHVVRNEKTRPKVLKRASLLPAPKWRMSVIDISPGLTLEPLRGLAVGPSTSVPQSVSGGGARSSWGVSQCGRYFFEVIVTGQQARSAVRVGWSVQRATLLLGEDRGGFGFGAPSLQIDGMGGAILSHKTLEQKSLQPSNAIWSVKITGGESTRLGDPLVSGDVVGCYLDLHRGSVFWSCNGNLLDDGLGLQIPAIHRRDPFFPTVSINNCSLLVNFGESPFVYPPPANSDWLAVSQAPRHLLVPNVWQGWHLNPYDVCDADDIHPPQRGSVQFSADALVAQTHGSAWVGVRANRGLQHSEEGLPTTPDGVTPALNGNYYYEIVLLELETSALVTLFLSGVIVGWSTENSSLCIGSEETGVGYGTDPDSFIIGSGKLPNYTIVGGKSCDRRVMGDQIFKVGDVIGCALDLDDWRIRWFVNGSEVRQTDGQELKVHVPLGHREKAYFPTVSLKNCTVLFNFGDTPFRYPPRIFSKPVSAAPKENVCVCKRQAPEKSQGSTWSTDCAELLKRLLVTGTSKSSTRTEQVFVGQSSEKDKFQPPSSISDTTNFCSVTSNTHDSAAISVTSTESTPPASHIMYTPNYVLPMEGGYFVPPIPGHAGSQTYYTTEYKSLIPGQPQVESVTYVTPEGNRVVRTIKRSRITSQQNQQQRTADSYSFHYHHGAPCPIQLMAELGEVSHSATAAVLPAPKVESTSCTATSPGKEPLSTYDQTDQTRFSIYSNIATSTPQILPHSNDLMGSNNAICTQEIPVDTSLVSMPTSGTGFMHKNSGPGVNTSCVEGIPAVVTKTAYYCYHPSGNNNVVTQEHRSSIDLNADEAAIRHLAQSINKRDSKGEIKEVTMFQTRHPCNATETTIVRKIRPVSNLLVQDEEQIV